MVFMGLYFGARAVGIAVSDGEAKTALGVECIRRKEENKLRQTLARIEELLVAEKASQIVLGVFEDYRSMEDDDSLPEWDPALLEFKEKLERRTGLPVCLFGFAGVDPVPVGRDGRPNPDKCRDEELVGAAVLLLQEFLDCTGDDE